MAVHPRLAKPSPPIRCSVTSVGPPHADDVRYSADETNGFRTPPRPCVDERCEHSVCNVLKKKHAAARNAVGVAVAVAWEELWRGKEGHLIVRIEV